MTAQVLATELSTLIQESKRKNADIKTAAEKSLNELKGLPTTSETQLASDLKRRPNFVRPFLLACATRNPKYAASAIVCLQRLVVSNALASETLSDVLDVLRDCNSLTLDIQLKILQLLPPLFQNYAEQLAGSLLATALHICFLLLASRTVVVSNTAAATLQQLVVVVLGRVGVEDGLSSEAAKVGEVPTEDGPISVSSAALDAFHLLNDLCLLAEGLRPEFLHPTTVSSDLVLELVESMLSNHFHTISSHPEYIHVLRSRLVPFIIRILSERAAFPTTVRAMRLLPAIFSNMLSVLPTECEMVLSLLNHMLDPDAGVIWKRVLCMEVFKIIHAEPALMRAIYALYDEQDGKRNVVRDHLALLARLASEKPALIGLGQRSSMPASAAHGNEDMDEQVPLQPEGVGGTIGVAMALKPSTAPGISTSVSTMRVPCLDQLDKIDAPAIPPAYLYSLALTCVNNFSEGLAKFLLPFSIFTDGRTRRKARQANQGYRTPSGSKDDADSGNNGTSDSKFSRTRATSTNKTPLDPKTLTDHPFFSQISTCSKMIESCWPALLAAYSTFFHAALDSDFYHALVRSFQKFTQVSGLLRLSTPRDAFLTTLGKNAVPSAVVSTFAAMSSENGINTNIAAASHSEKARQSVEIGSVGLNSRNLLCLRALLNLGIALGPILNGAWSIILETLQQADLIIAQLIPQHRQGGNGQSMLQDNSDNLNLGEVGDEIAAVKSAAAKMLEICAELPDLAFLSFITSLRSLLRNLGTGVETATTNSSRTESFIPLKDLPLAINTSETTASNSQHTIGNHFVIENLDRLIKLSTGRLLDGSPVQNGWNTVTTTLVQVSGAWSAEADLRLQAGKTLCNLVLITMAPEVSEASRNRARQQGLQALERLVKALHVGKVAETRTTKSCDAEIHRLSLETLRSSLELCGDSLVSGWDSIFTIIASAFDDNGGSFNQTSQPDAVGSARVIHAKSSQLVRSSFGSLQLICSDFLVSVPSTCLPMLLEITQSFCLQRDDFNISLTANTLFWNISDHLWQLAETIALDKEISKEPSRSLEARSGQPQYSSILIRIQWMELLRLLVETSADGRLEIRHSSLHTIFRILESCGPRLRPSDWTKCLEVVVLKLLGDNEATYQFFTLLDSNDQVKHISSWNETAINVVNQVAALLEQYLHTMLLHSEFVTLWVTIGEHFRILLQRQSLRVSVAVFTALGKVLSQGNSEKETFSPCAKVAWDIWQASNPASHGDVLSGDRVDNQPALVAYLQCLTELYLFVVQTLELEQLRTIHAQLQICATGSTLTQYNGDTDTMTQLQLQILNCMKLMQPAVAGAVSESVKNMSFFITLAYNQKASSSNAKGPTHIAMSKAAMSLLADYLVEHVNEHELYLSDAMMIAFQALAKPIRMKYKWQEEGRYPPPWEKATVTIVTVLKAVLPCLRELRIQDSADVAVWREILNICDGIVAADLESCTIKSRIRSDQEVDIDAFTEIYDMLIPLLGSKLLTDQHRHTFSASLFGNSIIHEAHPDDLPDQQGEILGGLRSVHMGRTQDLPPTRRAKMSYVLVDKLFDLVARHDGSLERVKLAQAVAPWLILRVGIVLKAYVLDHPLRGRMPQPLSQRREMLYMLRKLVELESEPRAIPDAPGVVSEHKKHLHRIYSLVTKALGVSRRDEEMQEALTQIIEAVSQDFGI